MRRRRPIGNLLLLAPLLAAAVPLGAGSSSAEPDRGLRLYRDLPRDPLIVLGASLDDPAEDLRDLIGTLGRFAPAAMGEPAAFSLAAFDRALAETLLADLVPRIGPELAVSIDFPPLDEAVSALHLPAEESSAVLLGRIGMLARVCDAASFDRDLRQLIVDAGGALVERDGLVEFSLPFGAEGTPPRPRRLRLYHAMRGDRWALGFSSDWIREVLGPLPGGRRLTDGEDFGTVFARLDSRPVELTYVNLPKLRAYVTESRIAQALLQGNAELREIVRRYFTEETMSSGLGSTSVRIDGGVRTVNFGPSWMSGAAVSSGFLAALALPRMLATVDRGRTRRTAADIEAIAEACEGFSSDARNYPGPTEGWVPVERIATFLEPVYIGQLPRIDGWRNPILYWSDGGSYRILSTGRDGRIDRDWTVEIDPVATTGRDSDIVFGDGRQLAWPTAIRAE